jgi:hypothetical protein
MPTATQIAAALGSAQRDVILSLTEEWGKASNHQCAKRMFWGVRGQGGRRLPRAVYLVNHKHRTDNCWSLTDLGVAVREALI